MPQVGSAAGWCSVRFEPASGQSARVGTRKGTGVANQNKRNEQLVVRKIDAGTWSVQKKAVPGFRLSKSTMAAAKTTTQPPKGRTGR